MHIDWTLFALFSLAVLAMVLLDLGVFRRQQQPFGMRSALLWSGFWICLALAFNASIWLASGWYFAAGDLERAIAGGHLPIGAGMAELGQLRSEEFLAAWLIEKALAVDNLFVFVLIFSAFAIPTVHQHKVLFYGILGALVMRTLFIFGGVALIEHFTWVLYVFGAFLVWTGVKMALPQAPLDPRNHWSVRLLRWFIPVSDRFDGDRLVTTVNGRRMATPLLAALLLIEATDLVFAVDSIPAVLAISNDTFIVFTSNVFAILGMRSLYFALNGMMENFHFLKYGLGAILVFVGTKMLLHVVEVKVPIDVSLAVIGLLLAVSVLVSLVHSRLKPGPRPSVRPSIPSPPLT